MEEEGPLVLSTPPCPYSAVPVHDLITDVLLSSCLTAHNLFFRYSQTSGLVSEIRHVAARTSHAASAMELVPEIQYVLCCLKYILLGILTIYCLVHLRRSGLTHALGHVYHSLQSYRNQYRRYDILAGRVSESLLEISSTAGYLHGRPARKSHTPVCSLDLGLH